MMWRWNRHIYAANVAKKSGRSHFANAIRLYGKDAFSHEVLRVCADLEEANAYEAYFINLFRTRDLASGFNLCLGGSHAPHPFRNPWDRPEYREANLASSRERLARATAAAQVADVQNRPDVRAAQSARMKAWAATQPGLQEKTAARYAGKNCRPSTGPKSRPTTPPSDPRCARSCRPNPKPLGPGLTSARPHLPARKVR